ncbi:ABC transporter permease [Robinsoniella peoriensis]
MFFSLLGKECKQILKSVIFYLYLIILAVFVSSQMEEYSVVTKPQPGQESYGMKESSDPKEIMQATAGKLMIDWHNNSYATYPIGFYKGVSLGEEDYNRVTEILEEVTGRTESELSRELEEDNSQTAVQTQPGTIMPPVSGRIEEISDTITYEQFKQLMKEVDSILGANGTSYYAPEKMAGNAMVPMTYEEALSEYQQIIDVDHVTGAFARIFCDYMVLMLAILPVFLAVTRGMRDRRAGASGLIYSRKASSVSIVLSRYLATLIMSMIPVVILSISPMMEAIYYARTLGVTTDVFSYMKYILGWLFPTAMAVVSVGFFFTELTDSALGILIQGIWWFIDINSAVRSGLVGGFRFHLAPRWNTVGESAKFTAEFQSLLTNRIFFAVLAVVLLIITIFIFEWKRKGIWKFNGIVYRSRKSKSEA